MVKVTFLEREFDLPQYMLGAMIEAAPFIDAQKARTADIERRAGVELKSTDTKEERATKTAAIVKVTTMADTFASMADILKVLHVGVAMINPTITIEQLIDSTPPTMERMSELMAVMAKVVRQGGLTDAGEARAPSGTAAPVEGSASSSAPSSSSSSPQA